MYRNGLELATICREQGKKLSLVVLENEAVLQDQSVEQGRERLGVLFDIMWEACQRTLQEEIPSLSGLTSGNAKRVWEYLAAENGICGDFLLRGVAYAFSCFEVNTSMGRVVATPTAGSCGIVPACIFTVMEKYSLGRDKAIDGLAASSGIGQIIAKNATVSGAEGGCQAECGSAAAMAAAAVVEMLGGPVEESLTAASIALKNVMGLVCDPVAGLVEVPCQKRNAIGVANALLAADLALAGVESVIPFDEVVEAMARVGRELPCSLRETAMGGIAVSKAGLEIKKRLEENSD